MNARKAAKNPPHPTMGATTMATIDGQTRPPDGLVASATTPTRGPASGNTHNMSKDQPNKDEPQFAFDFSPTAKAIVGTSATKTQASAAQSTRLRGRHFRTP